MSLSTNFPIICGGTQTGVERAGDVVPIRAVSCFHYLFVGKEDFYMSCGATPILVVSSQPRQHFCFSSLPAC